MSIYDLITEYSVRYPDKIKPEDMAKALEYLSGKRELTALEIDPEAVDPEDVEMLQDLVVAAVNEALRKAEDAASANMSRLTGGLNLGF